jgi:allantoicase
MSDETAINESPRFELLRVLPGDGEWMSWEAVHARLCWAGEEPDDSEDSTEWWTIARKECLALGEIEMERSEPDNTHCALRLRLTPKGKVARERKPKRQYCAQCWMNGSKQLLDAEGKCPNPRCVLKGAMR